MYNQEKIGSHTFTEFAIETGLYTQTYSVPAQTVSGLQTYIWYIPLTMN